MLLIRLDLFHLEKCLRDLHFIRETLKLTLGSSHAVSTYTVKSADDTNGKIRLSPPPPQAGCSAFTSPPLPSHFPLTSYSRHIPDIISLHLQIFHLENNSFYLNIIILYKIVIRSYQIDNQ